MGGNTTHNAIGGDIFDHHGICANHNVIADRNVAQDFGSGEDFDIVADGWATLRFISIPNDDLLVDPTVFSYVGVDSRTVPVLDKQPWPNVAGLANKQQNGFLVEDSGQVRQQDDQRFSLEQSIVVYISKLSILSE